MIRPKEGAASYQEALLEMGKCIFFVLSRNVLCLYLRNMRFGFVAAGAPFVLESKKKKDLTK